MNTESFTGYLALIPYIATLLPSNFLIIFSNFKKSYVRKTLLKSRREIGLVCFLFSIIHGLYVAHIHNMDFFSVDTYINYFTGLGSILIFSILAVTSNNWSMRKLRKNWKKLHRLTYLALILLIFHLVLAKQGVWAWHTWFAFITLCSMTCVWLFIIVRRMKANFPQNKEI